MIFLVTTLFGCVGKHPDINEKNSTFRIPAIRFPIVNRDGPEERHLYPISDSMENSVAVFAGKFKFSDSINLSNSNDTSLQKDKIKNFIFLDKYKDSMASDGFQIFTDYTKTVRDTSVPGPMERLFGNAYYPVFIVNETSSSKLLFAIESTVYVIQEAKDSNGVWRPIEYSPGGYWCGNSYWGLKVHPKEFVTILVAKHDGPYKTQIRVRVVVGDCVYISAPFEGTINYNKFRMKWWSHVHAYLMLDESSTIERRFYGANVLYDRNSRAEKLYIALSKPTKR